MYSLGAQARYAGAAVVEREQRESPCDRANELRPTALCWLATNYITGKLSLITLAAPLGLGVDGWEWGAGLKQQQTVLQRHLVELDP